jgi:Fe2+ or Zn2+ uptake regulation protein
VTVIRCSDLPCAAAEPSRPAASGALDALCCSRCGDVTPFDAKLAGVSWADALAGGFVVHAHRLVLFGRCAACRDSARPAREVRS